MNNVYVLYTVGSEMPGETVMMGVFSTLKLAEEAAFAYMVDTASYGWLSETPFVSHLIKVWRRPHHETLRISQQRVQTSL